MKVRRKKRKMMKIENSDNSMKSEIEKPSNAEQPDYSVALTKKSDSGEVPRNSIKICRLCLVFIDDNFVPLENILAMLQIVLPEVDPKITKKPVVCRMCCDFLEKASTFMINSLNVEQKIKNYHDEAKTEGEIDLFNVLEFSFPKIEMDNSATNEDESHYDVNSDFIPTDILEVNQPKDEDDSKIDEEESKPRPKLQVRANSDGVTFYNCSMCSFQTKYKYSIKIHMTMMHTNPDEIIMYSCSLCSFQTKHKRYLETYACT